MFNSEYCGFILIGFVFLFRHEYYVTNVDCAGVCVRVHVVY